MEFIHCDTDEKYLTLHDCFAERAYLEDGKLGFEFKDGFWILPDHPESNLSEVVRTDFSKAEYVLGRGHGFDVVVYVFEKTFFKKTVRTEWTVQKLMKEINSGKCRLEFLYQYVDDNCRIVECALRSDKKPYYRECMIKIYAPKVCYYWNNLREDCVW